MLCRGKPFFREVYNSIKTINFVSREGTVIVVPIARNLISDT